MPPKLLIVYNVKPAREEAYYRFLMGEFLPVMQSIGLEMVEAWGTAWGDYPQRLIGLTTDGQKALHEILNSERWHEMEAKLADYVDDYRRQVVPYRSGFQFLKPG
jgi:hypothetical protein